MQQGHGFGRWIGALRVGVKVRQATDLARTFSPEQGGRAADRLRQRLQSLGCAARSLHPAQCAMPLQQRARGISRQSQGWRSGWNRQALQTMLW